MKIALWRGKDHLGIFPCFLNPKYPNVLATNTHLGTLYLVKHRVYWYEEDLQIKGEIQITNSVF
jgi:hypothetical protein